MWFKTRVGLMGFGGEMPIEVLVSNTPNVTTGEKRWYVYARPLLQQDGGAKGIFGSIRWGNPILYLAMFLDGNGTQEAIAGCMGLIEDALRSGATFCDLSGIGDSSAWSENWKQISWSR